MSKFLRAAGTFVLGSVFTSAAMASPAMDAAFNVPGWSEIMRPPQRYRFVDRYSRRLGPNRQR